MTPVELAQIGAGVLVLVVVIAAYLVLKGANTRRSQVSRPRVEASIEDTEERKQ